MKIVVVGPGRAGGSLAVAARTAGHELVGLFGRHTRNQQLADRLGVRLRLIGEPLPEADLLVVAVRDDALAEVAATLSALAGRVRGAIHLSGLTSVRAMDPLGDAGLATGSFHPLQTLAGWQAGSLALPGAYVGITAAEDWATELEIFARSMGCRPIRVADDRKPLYHAAGGVAANYVAAALCVAEYMFREADVDPAAARPMVEQAVANAFDLGFRESLTGPISRGDLGTVRRQIEAVDRHAPAASEAFRVLTRLTAQLAGRVEVEEILRLAGPPPGAPPSPGPATEGGGPS